MQGLAWKAEELGIDFRAQAEYAFSADHLYTLGGYYHPAAGVLADVFVAPLAGGSAVAIVQHGVLEPGINFLQKPFTPGALAMKVREVLDAAN